MRKCPKCNINLLEIWLHSQQVDRCGECKGTFFDFEELGSIIRLVEMYRSIELDEEETETVAPILRDHHNCPNDGTEMERKDYGGVTVDVCGDCKGVWLDDGELFSLKTTENHIRENLNLYIRLAQ